MSGTQFHTHRILNLMISGDDKICHEFVRKVSRDDVRDVGMQIAPRRLPRPARQVGYPSSAARPPRRPVSWILGPLNNGWKEEIVPSVAKQRLARERGIFSSSVQMQSKGFPLGRDISWFKKSLPVLWKRQASFGAGVPSCDPAGKRRITTSSLAPGAAYVNTETGRCDGAA